VGDASLGRFDGHLVAELENLDVLRLHGRPERGVVNHAGAGRAVILRRELHVVDVEAGQPVGERRQILGVPDEAEVLLDLRVAGVVPVNDFRAGKLLQEIPEIIFRRQFLDAFAVFAGEFQSAFFRLRQQQLQRFLDPRERLFLPRVALGDGFGDKFLELRRVLRAAFKQLAKFAGVILQIHAAEVQHHERCLDAHGEIKRLERVTDGEFAVTIAFGGKFVEVRRGMRDADGQRTEIVERGNLDLARVHGFEDAGHEADADAVAQLGIFKTEVADFAQHGATVGVTVGIPAGRE